MLVDLREYVKALSRHWLGFVTGSAVALAGSVLAWRGIDLPPGSWGFVFVGGLLWAGFLAWREQYRRKPDPVVTAQIAHLIQLKESATHKILNASMANPPPDADWGLSYQRFMEAMRQADLNWQQRVIAVLPLAGATPGEISRYEVLGTFTAIPASTADHAQLKGMVAERIRRLEDLIAILERRNSGSLS